ncbi:hypothetical protein CO641_08425 [Lysobacteraceae bacterium NML91-0213]|nr:hypothetical protein CO641_08425 [Xanthomonadaceae bacterium NML91-0213]
MDNSRTLMWIALLLAAVLLTGCAVALAKNREQPARSLTLFAFNYTDRGLLDITVDGMWLGSASAYTNGGTAMGPRPPRDRSTPQSVDVTWSISASYYDLVTNKYVDDGELVVRHAQVPLKFPYPDDPKELILHFYPDGRVEAELIDRKDNAFDFRRIPVPEGHREHGRR